VTKTPSVPVHDCSCLLLFSNPIKTLAGSPDVLCCPSFFFLSSKNKMVSGRHMWTLCFLLPPQIHRPKTGWYTNAIGVADMDGAGPKLKYVQRMCGDKPFLQNTRVLHSWVCGPAISKRNHWLPMELEERATSEMSLRYRKTYRGIHAPFPCGFKRMNVTRYVRKALWYEVMGIFCLALSCRIRSQGGGSEV
jgi:hypothetical protein